MYMQLCIRTFKTHNAPYNMQGKNNLCLAVTEIKCMLYNQNINIFQNEQQNIGFC